MRSATRHLSTAIGALISRCSITVSRSRGELAQTLAEYSLLLAGVGVALAMGTTVVFRDSIASAFSSAATCIHAACDPQTLETASSDSDSGPGEDGGTGEAPRHCDDGRGRDGTRPGCRH